MDKGDKIKMVDYCYRRKIFRISEMAFGTFQDINGRKSDVVYMHSNDQKQEHYSDSKKIVVEQYTLVNDLLEEENVIYDGIKKQCRYEIRRSQKEEAQVMMFTSDQLLNRNDIITKFENTYNRMFEAKGLSNYTFNRKLVEAGITSGAIVISICTDRLKELEVFHAYLVDGCSTVLLYSASSIWNCDDKEKNNMIGRMNKFLHWKDIQWFKKNGYSRYEWGGISSPFEPNGIDRFKMEFGGEVKLFYNYIVSKSILGRAYIYIIRRRTGK